MKKERKNIIGTTVPSKVKLKQNETKYKENITRKLLTLDILHKMDTDKFKDQTNNRTERENRKQQKYKSVEKTRMEMCDNKIKGNNTNMPSCRTSPRKNHQEYRLKGKVYQKLW